MLTLSGCARYASTPRAASLGIAPFALPDLPARDAQHCYDPSVKAGEQALAELAKTRVALADCRAKHARLIAYYIALQKGLTSNVGDKNE